MSSSPTSPPDGSSIPHRHRSHLGNLAKNTTEKDLWALDELDSEAVTPVEDPVVLPRDFKKRKLQSLNEEPVPDIPILSRAKNDQDLPATRPEDEARNMKVNTTSKNTPKLPRPTLLGESPRKTKMPSDFDELEQWDEPDAAPMTRNTPKKASASAPTQISASAELTIEEVSSESFLETDFAESHSHTPEENEVTQKASKKTSPNSIKPDLQFSKLERMGLAVLVFVLLLAGTLIYLNTVNRLHGNGAQNQTNYFPIVGQNLTVQEADTYWRAPIADGPNPETFRRGTQLLPVVELTLGGGPAGIRVFFRNSDGELMGDVVTRKVEGGHKIQVAATVGFDDIGMHSAYRTGQSKPWTIEVHEAPSESSPASTFKKLFVMAISPDRR